jgi:hypothetical protein
MEAIHHYGSVRLRVTGSGDLEMSLFSLNDVKSVVLPSLAMESQTNREPTKQTNFTEQRAQLEIQTSDIDDRFVISKIIVFARPFATDYPG